MKALGAQNIVVTCVAFWVLMPLGNVITSHDYITWQWMLGMPAGLLAVDVARELFQRWKNRRADRRFFDGRR